MIKALESFLHTIGEWFEDAPRLEPIEFDKPDQEIIVAQALEAQQDLQKIKTLIRMVHNQTRAAREMDKAYHIGTTEEKLRTSDMYTYHCDRTNTAYEDLIAKPKGETESEKAD